MMGRRAEPGRVSGNSPNCSRKSRMTLHAGALGGADERDGMAEFVRERERVDLAAAVLHQIRHIKQHERRQAEGENRARRA